MVGTRTYSCAFSCGYGVEALLPEARDEATQSSLQGLRELGENTANHTSIYLVTGIGTYYLGYRIYVMHDNRYRCRRGPSQEKGNY